MTLRKTGVASIDKDSERLEALEKRSKAAKGLVGKLLAIPHADGHAYYTVEEEKGAKVRLEWHDIHDAWQDNILGGGGWAARKQVEPIIRRDEGFAEAMEGAARRQESENEKLQKSVVSAVVKDIGLDADVYDLAHWAWDRGNRGMKKADARIYKPGGRAPWADAIAHAIADSKLFPAVKALKDDYAFQGLADSFQDPRIYRNPAPAKESVLAKVREVFQEAVGVAPEGLDVVQTPSKYLTHTFLTIVSKSGIKVGSVCYDPKDGAVLNVQIGFQKDGKGKIKGNGQDE